MFQGDKHDALPQTLYDSRWHGQLMGWLASLTLDELPGLPLDMDVDFVIELHPGTSLISMTPYKMAPNELQELKVRIQELLENGFIRLSTLVRGTPVMFTKKEVKFKWNDPRERAFQELKRRLISALILIVSKMGQRYTVYCDASKNGLGCVLI